MAYRKHNNELSELLLIFLRFGITSFGGPTAYIGHYREAFVDRRKWLTEQASADLLALAGFVALNRWKAPSWAVVIVLALAGAWTSS